MKPILTVRNTKREKMGNIIRIRKYTLNSLAELTTYIDKCITDLNYLEEEGLEINEIYYELIYEFSDSISNNLEVTNFQDYNRIKNYIKRADIVLNSAFQDKDPEPIISSFNNLKGNLIKLNVLNQ